MAKERVDASESGKCPSCGKKVLFSTIWCKHCKAFVADEKVGKLADPAQRVQAFLLDLVFPLAGLLLWLFIYNALNMEKAKLNNQGPTAGAFGIFVFLVLIAGYLAASLLAFQQGTSLGKKLLSLYLVKASGERPSWLFVLFRDWFVRWLSFLPFGYGVLRIFIDPYHQGLHDRLMGSHVVYRPRHQEAALRKQEKEGQKQEIAAQPERELRCLSCGAALEPESNWCMQCKASVFDATLSLASFSRRGMSLALDILIGLVCLSLIFYAGGLVEASFPDRKVGEGFGVLTVLVLFALYFLGMTALFSRGTSFGKDLLGLSVVDSHGKRVGLATMLLREWVLRWGSLLPLALGLFAAFRNSFSWTWHDRWLGTYVVQRNRTPEDLPESKTETASAG